MGLQDRDYNRSGGGGNLLMQLLTGDFTLGYFAGIKIRIHVAMVFLLGFNLLSAGVIGWKVALTSSVILFSIVLLHEFGHCFAARAVGGRGDDVLLWPLGGLAFISTPRRPWPSFIGAAGGLMVNGAICIVCALLLRSLQGTWVVGNPLAPFLAGAAGGGWLDMSSNAAFYLWWIYSVSLSLLIFNLLPIFPLDGGRILQTILWPRLGFYQASNVACIVGMVGAVIVFLLSLGSLFMMFLMGSCFFYCYQMRANLGALADEAWEEERYGGYGSSNRPARPGLRVPRLRLMPGGAKPADDRFTLRDLNPLEWYAKRKRRKQFEKLVGGDD